MCIRDSASTDGTYAGGYVVHADNGKQYAATIAATGVVTVTGVTNPATLAAAAEVTPAGAATASPLDALDNALKQVDALRGSLGAVQNRFDSVISNLGTTVNNLTSSMSR